jgi:Tfp pilus assembly pilus retraction ATPase PilT
MNITQKAVIHYFGSGRDNGDVELRLQTLSIFSHDVMSSAMTREEREELSTLIGVTLGKAMEMIRTSYARKLNGVQEQAIQHNGGSETVPVGDIDQP